MFAQLPVCLRARLGAKQHKQQHAHDDVNDGVERDSRAESAGTRSEQDEDSQRGERHGGVDDASTALKQAEEPPLFLRTAELADAFQQRGPDQAVRAHRKQGEQDQERAEAGEGAEEQAKRSGADESEWDEEPGGEAVGEVAADDKQRRRDDGVDA